MTVIYEALTAWSRERRELPEEHAIALARSGVVTVEQADSPDSWWLNTDSKVGVLVGTGWQIGIRPKLAIPRLFFLLAYSLNPDGWRDTQAIFEREFQLHDAVAAGFSVYAERALRPGVLHGYVTRDEREPTVRGRVRFADQIARSPGLALPIEISYDEFTPNVIENRLLLSATEVLLRLPRIPPQARKCLLWVRATLEGVDVLSDARRVSAPDSTRLNRRYESALALAELIVRASSISAEHGRVDPRAATSFVFDMNEVFESFLTTRLKESFRRHHGGWIEAQRPAALAPGLGMRTDITWHGREGVRAVIDAKYKSLVDKRSMPNADAYQMLAYCIALGLACGYLVYAKDSQEHERVYEIVKHGYQIDVRSVDVELEPDELLAQVDAIAADVARRWRSAEIMAA
jgi:5-methylcytosine-specific restriction enzyme subunit McrC